MLMGAQLLIVIPHPGNNTAAAREVMMMHGAEWRLPPAGGGYIQLVRQVLNKEQQVDIEAVVYLMTGMPNLYTVYLWGSRPKDGALQSPLIGVAAME